MNCPNFKMLSILLLLVVALNRGCCGPNVHKRCLDNVPDIMHKRVIYVDQDMLGINIEVSSRTTHQILSRIVRILIKEIFNHENVSFSNTSDSLNAYTFHGMSSFTAPTNSIINIESWMPILYNLQDLDDHSNFISIGPLGALGKFGWYIPTHFHEKWRNHSVQCDQTLKQSDISMFASSVVYDQLKEIIENRRNKSALHLICGDNSVCIDGIFHNSEKCQSAPGSCPILIASHFHVYGSCLMEFINSLDLEVTVMWIGDHIYDYVLRKTNEDTPVMYFGWNLDALSATGLFTPIHIPHLHPQKVAGAVNNCDWQVRPIHKVVWNKLRVYFPEIHHLLSYMEFTNPQLLDLLKSYGDVYMKESTNALLNHGKDKILEDTACRWVTQNYKVWRKWLPKIDSKTQINIGGLFSFSGKSIRDYGSVIAAEHAAKYINNDPDILPNHNLGIMVADTSSVLSRKISSITSFMANRTHRVFGLLDTSAAPEFENLVGSLSTVYSIPLIGLNSKSFALSQRNLYPFFFRINSVYVDNSFALCEMFELFNWKRVGLFIEESVNFEGYHNFMKDFFGSRNINVAFDSKVPRINDLKILSDNLDQLKKKHINIVVAAIEFRNLLAFLCQIYDKKMTNSNNYSWMFVTSAPLVGNWWDINNKNFSQMKVNDCTQSKITEALQSHFIFHFTQLNKEKDIVIIGNKTSVEIESEIIASLPKDKPNYNVISNDAFDAMLVYGRAFHQLLQENSSALIHFHEESTLKRFVHIIETLHFEGLTGPIKFKGADRSGVVEIMQMQMDSFVKVGLFMPEQNNSTVYGLEMNTNKLHWRTSSGKAPSDSLDSETVCSVETIRALLGVECDNAIIFINVFVFGVTLIPIILFLIYIKKRYDDKIKLISRETPQIVGWELTRNEIILNRKIGQGEFGMVFGGEAKIKQMWVAVAVKALKPGSTSDDKVDFFSEARLMKDFSHENIIKLLGVCSIGEPGLVVMEFMLHGDLRSYLLSRRHLVNETSEEAMDVGPQAITKMAFDVSNGLKYLTNLGFVHRDLACRNCLIHETGIVKIGDFGLTENVYNSGYVRCVSNGKFPVRWMAPESLREGVFSSASDIWSLGVLMYEIFTFGALPYHGLSNEQVVVFVKNRKTIELPAGCPENLEKLLKECWSYESENRPTVYVIIDQLERMPLLLVPCLDVPRPQVGMDGSIGNNGLIVNFLDPVGNRASSSAKAQKSSAVTKHKTSLSGMSLLNSSKQLKFMHPEKSPDICSPQSTSAHCFDFPSLSVEGQFDLIKASDAKKWKEDSLDKNSDGHVLRNSNEVNNETKALLCNGCERSSTAPVLHRSVSTEPAVTAIFKKALDSKWNPDITTDVSGWTCRIPNGQQNSICHQQNKRHSRKKNSEISSSPVL